MKLLVPNLTADNALDVLAYLPEQLANNQFIVDFSGTRHYDPLGMLLFGSAMRRYRRRHYANDFYARSFQGSTYAGTMGFFKFISSDFPIGMSPGEAKGSNRYIPITELVPDAILEQHRQAVGGFPAVGDAIEDRAHRLARVISADNEGFEHIMAYILREIIRNVPEHAEINSCWICGQMWPSTGMAEIALLDEGIGIFRSLRNNPVHRNYLSNNLDALNWALKPGVSASFSPDRRPNNNLDDWQNSGFGLYAVNAICQELGGTFWLVSGEDYLKIENRTITAAKTQFPGTAIGIRMNIQRVNDSGKMIAEIVRSGEKEAQSIRHAFKVASVPSRGLMYGSQE